MIFLCLIVIVVCIIASVANKVNSDVLTHCKFHQWKKIDGRLLCVNCKKWVEETII